jgi:hypothetical protein
VLREKKMNNIYKRILEALALREDNLNMRGMRGDGPSHPYNHNSSQGRVRRVYGKSYYDMEDEHAEEDEHEEINQEKTPIEIPQVKISKAFLK